VPSIKPRTNLTLPDDLDEAIRDLADAVGKPRSTVIVELLQEMQDAMPAMAAMARMAKQGKKRAALQRLANLNADAIAQGQEIQRMLPLPTKRKRK
jgi:predicted DNA-binding protein